MSHMAEEEFHGQTCASPMLAPLLISHYRGINRTRLQKVALLCHTLSDISARQMAQTT